MRGGQRNDRTVKKSMERREIHRSQQSATNQTEMIEMQKTRTKTKSWKDMNSMQRNAAQMQRHATK